MKLISASLAEKQPFLRGLLLFLFELLGNQSSLTFPGIFLLPGIWRSTGLSPGVFSLMQFPTRKPLSLPTPSPCLCSVTYPIF